MRWTGVLVVLLALSFASAACQKTEGMKSEATEGMKSEADEVSESVEKAPVDAASQIEEKVKAISPEKAAEIATRIEEAPDQSETILAEYDLTAEEFEALMFDIASDPERSKAYAEAKK